MAELTGKVQGLNYKVKDLTKLLLDAHSAENVRMEILIKSFSPILHLPEPCYPHSLINLMSASHLRSHNDFLRTIIFILIILAYCIGTYPD